jgi:hypothetical protein
MLVTPPLAVRRPTRNRRPPPDWRRSLSTAPPAAPSPVIPGAFLEEVKEEDSDNEQQHLDQDQDSDNEADLGGFSPIPEEAHMAMVVAYESAFSGHHGEPRTYLESQRRQDAALWEEAALEELAAQLRNDAWELVECPPGVKPISSRWVFTIKHTSDGEIERYKARLVARGYTQRHGIDYIETFAPTCRIQSIRAVLALAASLGLVLRSIDISNAFLNGDIDAEIYMTQPEGFVQVGRNMVLRLKKAIYGTKQAARQWKAKLQSILANMGFTCIISDSSLYLYRRGDQFVALPFYVDDGLLAGSSDALLDEVVNRLCEDLLLRDLGTTEFILGIKVKVEGNLGRVSISQRQYVVDMLERFSMGDCKSVLTPMVPNQRLSAAD